MIKLLASAIRKVTHDVIRTQLDATHVAELLATLLAVHLVAARHVVAALRLLDKHVALGARAESAVGLLLSNEPLPMLLLLLLLLLLSALEHHATESTLASSTVSKLANKLAVLSRRPATDVAAGCAAARALCEDQLARCLPALELLNGLLTLWSFDFRPESPMAASSRAPTHSVWWCSLSRRRYSLCRVEIV
jgi:hypothetical protein